MLAHTALSTPAVVTDEQVDAALDTMLGKNWTHGAVKKRMRRVLEQYAASAPAQDEPVAWRVKRGLGSWGYIETKADADFLYPPAPDVTTEPLYSSAPVVSGEWQINAFRHTLEAAETLGMKGDGELSLAHLKDMYSRLNAGMPASKIGRWLGWAQAAVVSADVGLTLENMKTINMNASASAAHAPTPSVSIADAVKEEREACAKIAARYSGRVAELIDENIRARSKP